MRSLQAKAETDAATIAELEERITALEAEKEALTAEADQTDADEGSSAQTADTADLQGDTAASDSAEASSAADTSVPGETDGTAAAAQADAATIQPGGEPNPDSSASSDAEEADAASGSAEEAEETIAAPEDLTAGSELDPAQLAAYETDAYFQIYEISDTLFERIYGDDRSFKTYCTLSRDELRYLRVLYYNYDHAICSGEIMCNALIADDLLDIFRQLYDNQYEIALLTLVDNYNADDSASIAANNTSCFNYRAASNNPDILSNHAKGFAIDINPIQNPYFDILEDGSYSWEDPDADQYIDRTTDWQERHVITHDDLCYQLFIAHGFTWGGDWGNPLDYQHFEKPLY